MKQYTRRTLLIPVSLIALAACFAACSDSATQTADAGGGNEGDAAPVTDSGGSSSGDSGNKPDASGVDAAKATHMVKGTVTGLLGAGLVLQNNGADDVSVAAPPASDAGVSDGGIADGGAPTAIPFSFKTSVSEGAAYAVTVKTQPNGPAQTCSVTGGAGTMGTSDVTVSVVCSTKAFKVSGVVKGLSGAGLKLKNNGADEVSVAPNAGADVPFQFTAAVASGANYAVTVSVQPNGPTQACSVTKNGTGPIGSADVTNVEVTCSTSKYFVGGTLKGMFGSGAILQNNGTDDLAVDANGSFKFATPISSGAAYNVTVKTNPMAPAQTCTASANTGNMGAVDVTDVKVDCAAYYPTNGLLGFWNFDAVGSVPDLSGNGNDATNRNGTQVAGKLGKAYQLSGNGQCVTVPHNASLGLGGATAMSMMMWVNYTGNGILFNKENTWESAIQGGVFQYALWNNWTWFGNQAVATSTWKHVAFTWDGATAKTYVDGVTVFSRAQAGALTLQPNWGFGMGCRGVSPDGTIGGGNQYLTGTIDEAFVYDRALTQQELTDYINATK